MNGEIPDMKSLRIPLRYLANLLTAGDEKLVERALKRMIAMRAYKRSQQVDKVEDLEVLKQVGLTAVEVEEMYRYMAIANYEDRFVVPTSHKAYAENAYDMKSRCGFSFVAMVTTASTYLAAKRLAYAKSFLSHWRSKHESTECYFNTTRLPAR